MIKIKGKTCAIKYRAVAGSVELKRLTIKSKPSFPLIR